jgi:exodeoxyribonuclease VII large subunit
VVSGVGHEVDVTIADLAADLRAPTPSAAAEQVLPDRALLRGDLERDWRRLRRAAAALLERFSSRLGRERDALRVLAPSARLAAQRSRLEAGARALERVVAVQLAGWRSRLAEQAGRLESLSPLGVLARGYALVRRSRDGAIVRSAGQVARGERLAIRVAEAELEASVASARPLPKP